jgi:hypothetical protein
MEFLYVEIPLNQIRLLPSWRENRSASISDGELEQLRVLANPKMIGAWVICEFLSYSGRISLGF